MPVQSKTIDTEKALKEIQEVLKEYTYNRGNGGSLSDELIEVMATFSMVVDGILFQHECSANKPPSDMVTAIQLNWYKLRELIIQREEETQKLWDIAIKGNLKES
jgi:hypothetical protein